MALRFGTTLVLCASTSQGRFENHFYYELEFFLLQFIFHFKGLPYEE